MKIRLCTWFSNAEHFVLYLAIFYKLRNMYIRNLEQINFTSFRCTIIQSTVPTYDHFTVAPTWYNIITLVRLTNIVISGCSLNLQFSMD